MLATKKRQILSKHHKRISDTEMVLKYTTSLAFSTRLIILLHERIILSLNAILAVEPQNEQIRQHINKHRRDISTVKITPPTGIYIEPADERIAIDLARSISRLKGILRDELANNKIALQDCLVEEKKLELIRLKLRITNCQIKAVHFFQQRKYSITEKMLSDNLTLLESIAVKDEYLIDKLNHMTILLNKARYELSLIEKQKRLKKKLTKQLKI